MKTEEIKTKINEAGHKADDAVEEYAEKHNLPKWQVWLGVAAAIVLVGLTLKVFGVI